MTPEETTAYVAEALREALREAFAKYVNEPSTRATREEIERLAAEVLCTVRGEDGGSVATLIPGEGFNVSFNAQLCSVARETPE